MDGASFHQIGSSVLNGMFSSLNYQEKIWKQWSIAKILNIKYILNKILNKNKQNLILNRQIWDFWARLTKRVGERAC